VATRTEEQIQDQAWQRGFERGQADRAAGVSNPAPLSGEWAGESVREILGDLIDALLAMGCADDEAEWIADDYVAGYETGNDVPWQRDSAGVWGPLS
jgi:hypothetical protein